MPTPLTSTARRILRDLKTMGISLRALGRAARVPETTLTRIRRGALGASPSVGVQLATALEHWSRQCAAHARVLRAAVQRAAPRRRPGRS
jgi:lambda repressor-like predicted transcriptional regulator